LNRFHLVELEDLTWWPKTFRDAGTDYLVTAIRLGKVYNGVLPRLADAVKRSGATRIVDLCSGGGGPWPDLLPALRAKDVDATVCLTDKFPNVVALRRIAQENLGIEFEEQPIDATQVPKHLSGFRTLFTAFHHFRPEKARSILAAAVRDRQGIFIAEPGPRTLAALVTQLLIPLAVLIFTPAIRPFRWSRLFWTYLVPVLPLAILFDGVVSCVRIYSPEEMLAMGREASGNAYKWEAGFERPLGAPFPTPYLIGMPNDADKSEPEALAERI
jgi:hypothetical protein